MKRRLFLKTGTVGASGLIIIPSMLYGCAIVDDIMAPPSAGLDLFQNSAELFDSAIAELRTAGSGSLASAEAEDVDLAGLLEQITNKQAIVPAELAEDFASSSTSMLQASDALAESASEIPFPLDAGQTAEMAEDFALLKILKASTLLASAAAVTPQPIRKVVSAEKMISSAELVHSSINAGSESELIESTGELNAYAEEYVGAAETYSAEEAFILGVHNYGQSAKDFAASEYLEGGKSLLASTDNILISTDYFADGVSTLNAEAKFFNAAEVTTAAKMVPFSKYLMSESKTFQKLAKGDSAEMGADKMYGGAAEILTDAESNVFNLDKGGAELDTGADQFIAGTVTYTSAKSYTSNSKKFMIAAEGLEWGYNRAAEAEIVKTSELLLPAAEVFQSGAEALQTIELTSGVESLVPAMTEILVGAQIIERMAEAEGVEAEIGAAELLKGAELAEAGAIESFTNPAEFLESGAESVEIGTFQIMKGAAEFIEGYN